ncbi:MFS transporter [Nocardia cyriacigeorgica]|uniref:Antiseptic resistance protein n=1 Tax=Nocardia cyriacigeorgica TaxID=135487 RepID=A0A4U8W1N9_9NOCA|nr:MFS transporter [Nocardia cyriacigeorgica]VFA99075.1 Antiseptic resistance protein [Nocardia cyriacigeorgica]
MSRVDLRSTATREWAGLGLLALPTVLLGLDVTVLYLVLPRMAEALNPSATQTLWIMDAYGFFIAGFLLTMGTLGDRIGRRRLLVIGTTAFAAVSILAAFAPNAGLLIVARALLGVAGATLMPSTLSLISNIFRDARRRAVAIGIWATMFALGMAAGPVVGGALVDTFWWGAAFLLAVPVAAIVVALAPILLPEHADPHGGRLDPASVALSLAAILPVIYAVKHAAAHRPDLGTALLALAGLVAGAAFVRRQRGLSAPLLDVTLFANRAFSAALGVLLIGLIGVGGTMYLVTQYLQLVEGMTPFTAGLWMGPPALAMFAAAIGAPLLARRIRPGLLMAATLGVSVIGYALLTVAGTGDAVLVVTGFAFVYLGLGAIAALGTDMVVGATPAAQSGSAAAMSETVQELGLAVGVAVLGSLTTALYTARIAAPANVTAVVEGRVTDSLAGALSVADQVPAETVLAAREVFTSGVNVAAAVAGVAIVAATVVCLATLGHLRPLGDDHDDDAAEAMCPTGPEPAGGEHGHRERADRRAQGQGQ